MVVIGDSYRLKRILLNLISNSIKFTNSGHIKVTVQQIKKITDRSVIIRFTVKDTGIGMQASEQDLIYERFVRLTPSNQGYYKGLGLGLRIVKQFIKEMDGEIELESKLGEGSVFVCTIPFQLPLVNDIAVSL